MNVPPNTRPFDLSMAQQNHPLVTRAGQPAKFIAYVYEAEAFHQVVALVDNKIISYRQDGMYMGDEDASNDLFLAPLGYCQGLPVFGGDELISYGGYSSIELIATPEHNCFENFKWPSKTPIVETRMSYEDLAHHYYEFENDDCYNKEWDSASARNLANKAIERSIADGDVIPTSLFVEMACDVYNSIYTKGDYSFKDHASMVLKNYLENLK